MSGSSERVELGGYGQDTHIVNMYKLSNSKDIKMFWGTALKTAHLWCCRASLELCNSQAHVS